jgi:polygalacturonase
MKSILTFLALSTIAFNVAAADPLPGTRRCPVPAHGTVINASGNAIQAAINNAVAPATIVVAPGTYTVNTITPKSGVWLQGNGRVTLKSSQMVFALNQGQKDIWISGFTINGGPPATPCCQGVIVINGWGADIHIVNNTFINFNAGMWIWAPIASMSKALPSRPASSRSARA